MTNDLYILSFLFCMDIYTAHCSIFSGAMTSDYNLYTSSPSPFSESHLKTLLIQFYEHAGIFSWAKFCFQIQICPSATWIQIWTYSFNFSGVRLISDFTESRILARCPLSASLPMLMVVMQKYPVEWQTVGLIQHCPVPVLLQNTTETVEPLLIALSYSSILGMQSPESGFHFASEFLYPVLQQQMVLNGIKLIQTKYANTKMWCLLRPDPVIFTKTKLWLKNKE